MVFSAVPSTTASVIMKSLVQWVPFRQGGHVRNVQKAVKRSEKADNTHQSLSADFNVISGMQDFSQVSSGSTVWKEKPACSEAPQ